MSDDVSIEVDVVEIDAFEIVAVLILAGGNSSRFGSNKAWVQIEGVPLLSKLHSELVRDGFDPDQILVVAREQSEYASLDLNIIADRIPGMGPLAGLLFGLEHVQNYLHTNNNKPTATPQWCLVLTCDLIRWECGWRELFNKCLATNGPLSKVIVRRKSEQLESHAVGAWDPFPGLYRLDLIDGIKSHIAVGELAMHQLLESRTSNAATIQFSTESQPQTFNTQAELDRLM